MFLTKKTRDPDPHALSLFYSSISNLTMKKMMIPLIFFGIMNREKSFMEIEIKKKKSTLFLFQFKMNKNKISKNFFLFLNLSLFLFKECLSQESDTRLLRNDMVHF